MVGSQKIAVFGTRMQNEWWSINNQIIGFWIMNGNDEVGQPYKQHSRLVSATLQDWVTLKIQNQSETIYDESNERLQIAMSQRFAEANLGMFSMFGRTGMPTKRGPHKTTCLKLHTFCVHIIMLWECLTKCRWW